MVCGLVGVPLHDTYHPYHLHLPSRDAAGNHPEGGLLNGGHLLMERATYALLALQQPCGVTCPPAPRLE